MVLGVDAPGAGHAALHDVMVTQDYYDALPDMVKKHLVCSVVDELIPATQKHDIEGLVMGSTPTRNGRSPTTSGDRFQSVRLTEIDMHGYPIAGCRRRCGRPS
jgi:hypothetical protein